MGCPCEQTPATGPVLTQGTTATPLYTTDCGYTEAELHRWQQLLFCVKNGDHFTAATTLEEIHRALGTVISALNYGRSLCYFAPQLRTFEPLITRITTLNLCP